VQGEDGDRNRVGVLEREGALYFFPELQSAEVVKVRSLGVHRVLCNQPQLGLGIAAGECCKDH
jgi:hypothetical protein